MNPAIIAAVALGSCAVLVLGSGLRVIAEHQRGLVLRLGRRGPVLDPGLHLILPLGIDRLTRVDMRSAVLEVLPLEVMTRDGVPVRIGAAVHLQVLNPVLAVTRVTDYWQSTRQLVQAALRDVAARVALRSLLLDQDAVREALGRFVDARVEPWGLRISAIDVREVELPAAMQRTMERHADVLGQKQARRVQAEAEREAGQQLAVAAEVLATQPHEVQLRFLQALSAIGGGGATVVVVPLPTELVQPFIDLQGHAARAHPGDDGDGAEAAARTEQETGQSR
ncbi:MAG: slipin family protein [Candidatus Dormibacteraeota bacterium]|uniref:Slipin family protein n=1 Tax=Candidatus Amunia macphersoniae TaxID=3127014 RepID=A0A934NJM8_9BACT|nr:slipin family protein [Candidatus Dormibacteraeota bacterium]